MCLEKLDTFGGGLGHMLMYVYAGGKIKIIASVQL